MRTRPYTRLLRLSKPLVVAVAIALMALYASSAWASTITVNSLTDPIADDDNKCTLREAITNANADDQSGSDDCPAGDGADTITFSVNGTITLAFSADLPTITDDLTIDGPGAANLTIRQDFAPQGDTGRVLTVADDVTLNIQDITIANGEADENAGFGFGGGIRNSGTLNVTDSAFSENSAGFGGGIYNSGMLDVIGSTFSGNGALDGGGIFNAGGTATVTNSTFAGNTAVSSESGGGIYNADGGTFEVTNSTFSGNSAQVGANILNESGTTTLRNTIVAKPQAGGSCSGTVVDGGGNLDDGATCGFINPLSQSNTPAGLDPAGLEDNGGPTRTIALVSGSAAIDVGVDATCATPPVNNLDQRGISRTHDGDGTARCDIGAFELEEVPDTTKPTITDLTPPPGSTSNKNGRDIEATVKDDRSVLEKEDIRLFLDGQERGRFSYDPSSGRLVFDKMERLGARKHSARIEATDEAGNIAKERWTFRIR